MRKSIAWLSLAATSLALAGCGGGEDAAKDAKPAAEAKKKGKKGKEEVNPWAKDAPGADVAEDTSKKKKKKGAKKGEDEISPWAKDPEPGSPEALALEKQQEKKRKKKR